MPQDSPTRARPSHAFVLQGVLECTSEFTGERVDRLSGTVRPVDDLGLDSLDLIEWFEAIEQRFDVDLADPDRLDDQAYKRAFTEPDFTLARAAELVLMRWGSGRRQHPAADPAGLVDLDRVVFSQRGWAADIDADPGAPSYEELGADGEGRRLLLRRADGMPCVVVPGGTVALGSDGAEVGDDEQPAHVVELAAYAIDLELVSTTAYCLFLDSVGDVPEDQLRRWFLLEDGDRRSRHQVVVRGGAGWEPRPGAAEWPMVLVSWHGARAYARWAHGEDPLSDDGPSYLPTEAQWEHAARGATTTRWPWGDPDPRPGLLRAGRARWAKTHDLLPLGPVHAIDGLSPFGLRGMLGHVWQWCADWYAADAYATRAAGVLDPEYSEPTGVRAERGGSWVGPASLCRPAYRRGRVPDARGRCLGFRCATVDPGVEGGR